MPWNLFTAFPALISWWAATSTLATSRVGKILSLILWFYRPTVADGIGVYTIEVDPETRGIVGYSLPEADGSVVTLYEDEYWPEPEVSQFLSERIDSAEVGMDEPIGEALVDLTRIGVGESVLAIW